MANQKHLKILKSGKNQWNEWREERVVVPDLSEINLRGFDLSDYFLSQANFSKSNLSNCNLSNTDLDLANLSHTQLLNTDLSEAYLSGADLYESNLSQSKLNGSTLEGANLFYADLSCANLSYANLAGAILCGTKFFQTELTETVLNSTVFGLTDLSSCLNLESVQVQSKCVIDFFTLQKSKNLPKSFLLKIGLPELYIEYLPDFYSDTLTLFPAFLSHSKENREFARKLYEALIAKGVNVFFDEKQLKPGDSLVKTITKGINHYDKTILVCSKESLKSTWVDYELELVLKKELALIEQKGSDDVGLLIPITIDDHIFSWKGPKEWDIKNRFIGDFREWKDGARFERALNELIHALNIKRPDIKPPSFL